MCLAANLIRTVGIGPSWIFPHQRFWVSRVIAPESALNLLTIVARRHAQQPEVHKTGKWACPTPTFPVTQVVKTTGKNSLQHPCTAYQCTKYTAST